MYENILEILDFDEYKSGLLVSVGTLAFIGINTYFFYENPQISDKNSKQIIKAPLNPNGLENKLSPQKKPTKNIFYSGPSEYV